MRNSSVLAENNVHTTHQNEKHSSESENKNLFQIPSKEILDHLKFQLHSSTVPWIRTEPIMIFISTHCSAYDYVNVSLFLS